ncbi:hypothetical protein OIU84_019332 [Salix udensis]|uniref:Uncharacterized protein n=1 Tax=Salix udensis TaxID=889485 RepID=A0AAD6L102_9ROSI|nr:hypothetical protein OIU84_019332 [Salix udensis]
MEKIKKLLTLNYMQKRKYDSKPTKQLRNKTNHKCKQMVCFTLTKKVIKTYIVCL